MLKKSKDFLKLRKSINNLINDEVVDIILFGSAAKEKTLPNDIDIAIIFRKEIRRDILKKFQDSLGEEYHISSLVVDKFFVKPHSLAKTLLLEGISLLTNKSLAENFDLKSYTLYTYDLTSEKSSKKVRFIYLMKGRAGNKGVVEKFGGSYIAASSFTVPIDKDEEMLEILKAWSVKFFRRKIMLMG